MSRKIFLGFEQILEVYTENFLWRVKDSFLTLKDFSSVLTFFGGVEKFFSDRNICGRSRNFCFTKSFSGGSEKFIWKAEIFFR